MLNFAWLAKQSTGRRPWLFGIIPPIGTLITLLAVSAAIAGGMWLWTGLWAGALASATSFFPLLEGALVGVLGFTLVNFWFNREITTFMLSTREARDDFVFGQKSNPTNLRKLVNHLRQEVNAHFRKKLGKDHRDIPMPRLLTFTDDAVKIVTVEGRNPGKAAIAFSSGTFLYEKSNMDQRQLAALIEMELVKIYLRRGFSRTIVGMGSDLASTLQNLNASGSWFYRVLGFLAGPLQFVLLLERAIHRSYEYEAAGHVVECGRGVDLIGGIDKKVCSTLETLPTNEELKQNQTKHQRKPYNGYFKWLIKPIADWIDKNEYAGDDKTGSRFVSFFDILVREGGYYINELWKKEPRATNLKAYLRPIIAANIDGKNVSMDNATTVQVKKIREHDIQVNKKLYDRIPAKDHYDVIGPKGTGYVKPILHSANRRATNPAQTNEESTSMRLRPRVRSN
ncbi:MAG: hypothetical protein BGO43_06790 [Gammaproteobacteria bacterium 39-13]|nr:hypothetical protein [Gammaproteobacteria bacterium]OJV90543.1 MAG: hypothetical protein BGO43_06790 [Gammaproteobacteria bacterium 39-13]